MTVRLTRWQGPAGRATLLVLAVALIALPVAANDQPRTPGTTTTQASLRQLAAREAARTPLTASSASATRHAEQSPAGKESPTFFKTRPGMIALVIMAAGTGYAVYSMKHDKINSPGKK